MENFRWNFDKGLEEEKSFHSLIDFSSRSLYIQPTKGGKFDIKEIFSF